MFKPTRADIGVELEINVEEQVAWQAMATAMAHPEVMISTGGSYPDPMAFFNDVRTDHGVNYSIGSNPKLDALFEEAASTLDSDARVKLILEGGRNRCGRGLDDTAAPSDDIQPVAAMARRLRRRDGYLLSDVAEIRLDKRGYEEVGHETLSLSAHHGDGNRGPKPSLGPLFYAAHRLRCSRQGQDRCYRRSYSCRPVESWFVAPSLSCTSVDSGTASTLLTPSPLRRPALPAPHPVGLCPPQHPAQPRVFVQYPQVVHGLATSQVQQKQ